MGTRIPLSRAEEESRSLQQRLEMSTAEIGLSLAEMIRVGKVHAITTTGANLEEDLYNLVAHDHYERVRDWRNLTPADEKRLEQRGRSRRGIDAESDGDQQGGRHTQEAPGEGGAFGQRDQHAGDGRDEPAREAATRLGPVAPAAER